MEHQLKINKITLQRLIDGTRKAVIVLNKDYQLGEILKINDVTDVNYDFNHKCYVYFKITHIYSGSELQQGYVCLSVEQIQINDNCKPIDKTDPKYLVTVNKKILQDWCTNVAEYVPIIHTWDNNKKAPWGCILNNKIMGYCDECPVKEICPHEYKLWSK